MIDLDELMRLHASATPGPWVNSSRGVLAADGHLATSLRADCEFIAAAYNAMPELIAMVRELEAQVLGGKMMTEEKKQQVAKMLTRTCHLEANYGGLCPVGDGGDCPFMEDLCQDITPEDWKAWMESEE